MKSRYIVDIVFEYSNIVSTKLNVNKKLNKG